MAIDKRYLHYVTEKEFLKDKNNGNIQDKSIAFISEDGKRAIYTHGKFYSPESFIIGSQTSSTNAFTGTINTIDSLYDGLSIKYWLPFNGTTTSATLNLSINGVTTGAIPVYAKGTTRFTNQIGESNVINLVYRENVGNIEKGWWVVGSIGSGDDSNDSNTTYTFTSGTDGSFKVTPSNGSEQVVDIGKPETAGTADKVEKKFTLQVNSGSTAGTNLFEYDGSSAKTVNIKAGNNISIETPNLSGNIVISGNYQNASTTSSGLMSASDKTKLNNISEEANKYVHPSHDEQNLGLYKISVDSEGHVDSVSGITKSDITALGIPGQDTNTHYESKNVVGSATSTSNTTSALSNGSVYLNSVENGAVTSSHKISGSGNTTVKTDASGNIIVNSPTTIAWGSVTGKPESFTPSDHEHTVSDITDFPETQELTVNGTAYDVYTSETSLPSFYAPSTLGSNGQVLKSDGSKLVWDTDKDSNTWRGIALTDGAEDTTVLGTGTNTGSLKFKAGNNVSLSADSGVITINSSYTNTDTTYTFASGTNGSFSVTPKGGSKQAVSIGKPAEAGKADEVANALTLTVNSGTTEGTDKYTFTGVDSKVLNITAGSNVTLTPSAGGLQISSSFTNTDSKAKVTTGTTTKSYLVGVNSSGYTSGNATDKFITDTGVYLDTTAGKLTATTLSATTLTGNLKGTIDGTTTAVTASAGDSSTKVATTAFVGTAISNALGELADAMVFKGIVNSNSDLPSTHEVGWTYRVGTKGTYASAACEVGDLIICITEGSTATNSHWTIAQNNIDGAVTGPTSATDGNFALFSGTTGKIIKNSTYNPASFTYTAGTGLKKSGNEFSIDTALTEGTYGPEADITGNNGTTVVIPQIKVDENGIISEISEFTYTSKNTDTHYTTGLYVGASGSKTNAATSNGGTYLKLYDNDTSRASFKISGSGATTVKSDASGNITINSTDTTYDDFVGATSSAAGSSGLVPAAAAGENGLFLKADGTWATPTNTVYTHPTYTARTGKPTANATPAFGETFTVSQITSNGTGHVTGATDRTITIPSSVATTSAAGLMSAADKTKLDGITAGANKYSLPEATTSALGGIKIAKDNANYTVTTATSSITANVTSGKYYGVELDSTGKAFVYVPWSNTTYTAMTATEATAGTATTARTITAEVLHDKITELLPAVTQTATSGNEIGSVGGTKLYAPIQTTVSGNAGSATKLANARTIDGVSFNGTAAITHYGTCSTAAATAAKTVALTSFSLVTGARVAVKFTVTNTASSPTLNVNSTGAKAIMYRGTAISAGYLAANRVYEFIYDGTDYELVGDINTDSNTTYGGDRGISLVSGKFGHSNTAITAKTAYVDTDADASISVSANGGSFKVTDVKYDTYGHITGSQDRTITLSEAYKGTVTSVTLTQGTGITVSNTGTAITSSGSRTISLNKATTDTIGGIRATAVSTSSVSITGKVYGVQVDKDGIAYVSVPWADNTDTKTTAGATEKTGTKMYLVGATIQEASPQTYSNSYVYIGTDNCLYSNKAKVSVDGHTHSQYLTSVTAHSQSYTTLTGSGTTANQAIVSSGTANGWKLYTLGSAAGYGATESVAKDSKALVTSGAVYTAIANSFAANDAMIFKGTIGTSGTVTALPATHNVGWTYRVITAGTYAGIACEIGDLIICITDGTAANNAHWTVAQTNIDGAVVGPTSATDGHVAVFSGTSGKIIKSSGFTLGCSVPSGAKFTDTTYTLSSFGITATATELNYCDGVTSNIQTQLNGKAASSHTHNYLTTSSELTSNVVSNSVTQAITTSWANIVTAANMANYCPAAGTYIIQVSGSSIGVSSGVFSWNTSGSTNDEILLHRTGATTNIYLRLSSRALQIAGSAAVASGAISIKVKRIM